MHREVFIVKESGIYSYRCDVQGLRYALHDVHRCT
jgi:hypothetical protein